MLREQAYFQNSTPKRIREPKRRAYGRESDLFGCTHGLCESSPRIYGTFLNSNVTLMLKITELAFILASSQRGTSLLGQAPKKFSPTSRGEVFGRCCLLVG